MADSLEKQFETQLGSITYDETGRSILEAEMVHGCVVNKDFAKITLILAETSPLRKTLPAVVEKRIFEIPGIRRVVVEVLSEPPPAESGPRPETNRPIQQPKRTSYLQNYDVIIAVASGKGGVGKSTVSVNLALALAKLGHAVSLFDADIYGPSLPIMMGLRGEKPALKNNRLIPLERYGIHMMSIGNLIDESASMVWRGPMVHQAIEQLLRDTDWPGGQFMILDLPPGTGDVQLTLSQTCEITGAVVVSTPQDVALLDAVKAIHMFNKVDIPILGIVENMSTFICPHCEHETAIFSRHGAEQASQEHKVPFLGAIPIELAIREGGDAGKPVMADALPSPSTKAFQQIAEKLLLTLAG